MRNIFQLESFDGEFSSSRRRLFCEPKFFCFGNSGGSQSSTTNTTTTATDNGKIVTGAQAVTTGDSSLAVGAGGTYTESGGLTAQDNSGVISINDPAELTGLVNNFLTAYQNLQANATAADSSGNQAVISAITGLATSDSTAGLSGVTNVYLYMGLGFLAVIAIVFYPRSKK
jgi:hypothetical protein